MWENHGYSRASIKFDRKILALLQGDARLTNNDLSERVNLSPSQCSRRRQRLEEDGFIRGYRAVLDRDKLGFSLVNVISVTLVRRTTATMRGASASCCRACPRCRRRTR